MEVLPYDAHLDATSWSVFERRTNVTELKPVAISQDPSLAFEFVR